MPRYLHLLTPPPQAILLLPGAWDVLTKEEKQDVLARLPDETHILDAGTENARPNLESMRNDDNFRHDCARYCENIALGRHDEEWLIQAWAAHEKHKRGDFNQFLRSQVEEEWGIELPSDDQPANAHLDYGSEAGPANLAKANSAKQDTPKSTEQSQQVHTVGGAREAAASPPTLQSPSLPADIGVASSPRQGLQNGDKTSGNRQTMVARQAPQSSIVIDSSEPSQSPKQPNGDLSNASVTRQHQDQEQAKNANRSQSE